MASEYVIAGLGRPRPKQDKGSSIFVGIIHDLTERERMERVLRESAARLGAVVDTAVDGVILIDAQGLIMKFNPACEKLFKYSAGEVTGRNVRMLMPAPYQSEHDGYIRNFLTTGERKIIAALTVRFRAGVESRSKTAPNTQRGFRASLGSSSAGRAGPRPARRGRRGVTSSARSSG